MNLGNRECRYNEHRVMGLSEESGARLLWMRPVLVSSSSLNSWARVLSCLLPSALVIGEMGGPIPILQMSKPRPRDVETTTQGS